MDRQSRVILVVVATLLFTLSMILPPAISAESPYFVGVTPVCGDVVSAWTFRIVGIRGIYLDGRFVASLFMVAAALATLCDCRRMAECIAWTAVVLCVPLGMPSFQRVYTGFWFWIGAAFLLALGNRLTKHAEPGVGAGSR